jgi:GNAT superfamily N-acetyltransferase
MVTYKKASITDLETLIKLRLEFLTEDRGRLNKRETDIIIAQLQDYFNRQINNSFVAFLAEDDGVAIATVYMTIEERPANPAFITGKTATILNVFTHSDYRRKGIAARLFKMTVDEAKALDISYLELSATDSGKPLYEKFGFKQKQSKYTEMKLELV